MSGSRAVAGRGDGGEGGLVVLLLDRDGARIYQQLLVAVVDLRIAPPQGVQGCLCAQRLHSTVS